MGDEILYVRAVPLISRSALRPSIEIVGYAAMVRVAGF
jgi:hypothetical protein